MTANSARRILCIADQGEETSELPEILAGVCDVVTVAPDKATEALAEGNYDGLFVVNRNRPTPGPYWNLLQASSIFDQLCDGYAVVDEDNVIVWTNRKLARWFSKRPLVGQDFFDALGKPSFQGDSANPLASAFRTGEARTATLRVSKRLHYRVTASPMDNTRTDVPCLLVSLSDISNEVRHLQKLEAIHNAGAELADLTPEEVYRMNVQERIELLKANILHYTQDVLEYDVVEIRLIDRKTNRCEALLSEGIDSEESRKPLFAEKRDNGVTGFVCATGQSYLCEDTTRDPLYVRGLLTARSSLTVPLIFHDQVIGSFNVESPETGAFREEDLQLLQIFARDIARALNTLELLVAEKANAAHGVVDIIQTGVGLPIDEVLNDTVWLIENSEPGSESASRRLRHILKNSRAIRNVIQAARDQMTFDEAAPEAIQRSRRPLLRNRRILVIDTDDQIRDSAHKLLEPFGCVVETAHEGAEAIMMVRNCEPEAGYDAVIADIRLPDFSGYEILMRLKATTPDPPLILMTGFGYDPGHSIVKARQAGLRPNSVVYKPFKIDQLLETLERTIRHNESPSEASAGEAAPENAQG